ncbi:hypothetical protein AXX17_AT1G15190 [Arabidopsis thaliana]|uniref:Uncharacterized protein n=1 Tax=Arabidopsis thaliana TaxID=3702 RepID=A0A178W0A3_ARATH|nr:hypothetical protein AXX17_AT1G15190 [Arabidopsis thaliana]
MNADANASGFLMMQEQSPTTTPDLRLWQTLSIPAAKVAPFLVSSDYRCKYHL